VGSTLDPRGLSQRRPGRPPVAGVSHRTPIRHLLADIGHGAEGVAAIVRALKSYTSLDRAPVQTWTCTAARFGWTRCQGAPASRYSSPSLPGDTPHASPLNGATNRYRPAAQRMPVHAGRARSHEASCSTSEGYCSASHDSRSRSRDHSVSSSVLNGSARGQRSVADRGEHRRSHLSTGTTPGWGD